VASIRLDHVTKRFDGHHPAVDDVSLDIADGEIVILVGPSGGGKSTILRMILGTEDITSGAVYLDDERVDNRPPRQRNLATVFPDHSLSPRLTVFQNIALPFALSKCPDGEVRDRVVWAAKILRLTEVLDRKPAQLSEGQRQRVALGRAIVRRARAYLFDEPLRDVDAKLRGHMRTEISRLHHELGITIAYVTHDQAEAMTLGDRVAVLRKGRLQQVDTPRRLYEQPVNIFVAGFIGLPSMNLLPARVEGRRVRLPIGEVQMTGDVAAKIAGHEVLIAGIRPERVADAACVAPDRRRLGIAFRATVDVVEWLGREQFAYMPFDVPPEIRRRLSDLAAELDVDQIRTQWIAVMDGSRHIGEGTEAEMWVDPTGMHLFDPHSGRALARVGPVPAPSVAARA
jgi:multiple sugar transport system ATP-binding protein